MGLVWRLLVGSAAAVWPLTAGGQEIALLFEAEDPPISVPEPQDTLETEPIPPAPVRELESTPAPAADAGPPAVPGEWVVEEPWPPAYFDAFSDPTGPEYGLEPMHSCPWWRPCGPGNSLGGNWLFYQGAYGADFRAACINHDDCLMNPYNSRYGCDRAFYDQMAAACANSSHPALCMWKAKKYYVGVRVFGGLVRYGAP